MSVDAVKPSLPSQAVHPGQDVHDDRQPDSRSQGQSRQSGGDPQDQADLHPILNDLGQLTGRTINTTA